MYRRQGSSVVTYTPSGTNPRWLGTIGHMSELKFSHSLPGGPDAMSCVLQIEPKYRTDAMDPGRIVKVHRGASVVWEGELNEPVPSEKGWEISANGAGTYGDNYLNIYTTWNGDDSVNQAITRGLRWKNDGVGSGLYLLQPQDSGSQTITDFLNAITLPANKTWYVDKNNFLHVIDIPSTVTRYLVASAPVARTLAGYINALYVRYQATADSDTTQASYSLTSSTNDASITKHQRREAYWDLSSAGTLSSSTAAGYASSALSKYSATSYAGPFPIFPGQLYNAGGAEVDLGAERAGEVVQLVAMDGAYGGEVTPTPPIVFPVGKFEYDDLSQQASITPFQSVRDDLSSFLSAMASLIQKPSAAQ